jgi:hypothetical protein
VMGLIEDDRALAFNESGAAFLGGRRIGLERAGLTVIHHVFRARLSRSGSDAEGENERRGAEQSKVTNGSYPSSGVAAPRSPPRRRCEGQRVEMSRGSAPALSRGGKGEA